MKINFAEAMRRATQATRARDLGKATAILQEALSGRARDHDDEASSEAGHAAESAAPRLAAPDRPDRKRWRLGEVVRLLRGAPTASPNLAPPDPEPAEPPPTTEASQFLTRSFTCAAGTRRYKLYVPGSATPARGLIIMLHGCQQNPDDFALGTDMNAVAEARGLLVAYPWQARSANVSMCWNWFQPAHQTRDAGEPAILAGITREIVAEFGLDRRGVFVAGLSAGGAMAVVLGETYPDLYAAVGVHSGLPYRAANDVMSALAAMKGQADVASPKAPSEPRPRVRAIIFHGDQDQTVHPANANRVADAAVAQAGSKLARREDDGVMGGRRRATTRFSGPDGVPLVELWRIEGAGHAWSGGNPRGSFADSNGPNASEEMVRFFREDGLK